MIAVAAVHTTGVNWVSVIAICVGVATLMSLIIGIFAKVISGQITSAIDRFRNEVVNMLEHRLTVVEVKVDNLVSRKAPE